MLFNNKLRIIIVIFYAVITLLAVLAAYKASDFSVLDESNSLTLFAESFSGEFDSHRLTANEAGFQTYSTKFSLEDVDSIETRTIKVFINKITDNAFRVYINDVLIGHEGDMEKGHSMLKNSPNIMTFDKNIIKEENNLRIETYATYKSGIESEAIYLTDSIVGMELEKDLLFYGTRIILLGIGFIIFSAALMVFIYYINAKKQSAFIYCALATLFIGIYFVDYIKVISIPLDYFVYKKVFMISLYLGSAFYTMAISRFIKKSRLNYFTFATVFSFIVMSLLAPNLVVYKELYEYWYLLLLVNIFLWFGVGVYNIKKSEQAFIFVIGFLNLTIYSSFAILIEFFGGAFTLNSPLVYIVIIATLPLLLGFEEIRYKERRISFEQEQRENEFLNSITDELTGAWNQRYLYMKMRENPTGVTLAMIDLDDFKIVNDNYGHLAGDYVLKEISSFVLKSIRKTDDFCRYGGDEFVAMLYGCDDTEAFNTMEKVRKSIEEHDFIFNTQLIKVTVSIGLYGTKVDETLEESLKKADKELYLSKEHGKNFVSVHINDFDTNYGET